MDFTKTCRTCLVIEDEEAEMQSIFAFDEDKQFSSMIAACSETEVAHHDGLPDRICLVCCDQLRSCLAFKIKCENSFKTLQLYRQAMLKDDNPDGEQHNTSNATRTTDDPASVYRKYKDRELFTAEPNEKCVQTDEVTFYMCEMCDMKFVSEDALKMHRPLHKDSGFKCNVCSTMFGRLTHLRRHIALAHPEIAKDDAQKQFDIVCNVCDRRFARTDNLQRHMLTHIGDVKSDHNDAEEQRWECSECKMSFASNEEFVAHGNCKEIINNEKQDDKEKKFDGKTKESGISTEHQIDKKPKDDEYKQLSTNDLSRQSLEPEIYTDNSETEIESDVNVKEIPEAMDEEELGDEKPVIAPQKRGRGRPRKAPPVPPSIVTSPAKRGRKPLAATPTTAKESASSVFQCHKCPKIFTRHTHLKRHLIIHSDVKPFVCEVCDKGFTRIDHLNIHRHHHSPVKPYNCEICQRGFTRAAHLQKHKECRHTEGRRTAPQSTTVATHLCEMCPKDFPTSKSLLLHMKVHTEKLYVCKFCHIRFPNREELSEHNKLHIHEKPYLCSECGARFVRNDYLTVHMRRHKGDKPYKCQYCGKGFPRATDLTVHERYHTNEKTHLCTTCGKGFQRAYNLLVHMRVHTGERPYQCPHCEKSFAQGNDLKAHVRRHTGERYKCDVCGEGFIQGYHLTQHKKKKHGIDVQSHIQRVEKFVQIKLDDDHDDDDEEVEGEEEGLHMVEEIMVEELHGVEYAIEKVEEDLLDDNVMVHEEDLRRMEDDENDGNIIEYDM